MGKISYLNPYEELANAVILQAVRDYREAVFKLSQGKVNHTAEQIKRDCERFFTSGRFYIFTNLDGKVLLSRLEKEVRYDS